MPQVERIVAAILSEVESILRRLRFVRAACIADAVPVGPPQTSREAIAESRVVRDCANDARPVRLCPQGSADSNK